jgi:hypothetical protein
MTPDIKLNQKVNTRKMIARVGVTRYTCLQHLYFKYLYSEDIIFERF